jgi:hypothetical protein
MPSDLFFFLRIILAIQSLLQFHMDFRIAFSVSVMSVIDILLGISLNLWITVANV